MSTAQRASAPPKPPCYPDPDEDDLNDLEDDSEASEMELGKPEDSTNEVKEGDHIFITIYMPPETICVTSTISQ